MHRCRRTTLPDAYPRVLRLARRIHALGQLQRHLNELRTFHSNIIGQQTLDGQEEVVSGNAHEATVHRKICDRVVQVHSRAIVLGQQIESLM